eukprot:4120803-Amphidinium_carterae.1
MSREIVVSDDDGATLRAEVAYMGNTFCCRSQATDGPRSCSLTNSPNFTGQGNLGSAHGSLQESFASNSAVNHA